MKIKQFIVVVIATLIGISLSTSGITEDHSDHEEENHDSSGVTLSMSQMKLAEIKTATATLGKINNGLLLTGEVALDQDRLAHIAPRVKGIARRVIKSLGDEVKKNEVLAILDSRELAEAKSSFLAKNERLALAQANYDREEGLWKNKISSEQEYLDAKQALAESKIELRSSEQGLLSLGLSEEEIAILHEERGPSLTRYEIKAPFDGTIIEKHITLGEQVQEDAELYTLSNLDTVWVIANVYEKDISKINRGQLANFTVKAYPHHSFSGEVTWIADIIDEQTRTLKIRLEIDNKKRLLKPGMFVQITMPLMTIKNVLTIPVSAIQKHMGETIVFVDEGEGFFERRELKVGIYSATFIEVLDGIEKGEKVVTHGSFILKSELEKESFEAGHAH